jgi:hypothetical protein
VRQFGRIKAIAAVCAVFAAALPGSAAAQLVDADAPTRAIILRPNTLVNVEDLDFGSFLSGPTPGTVTINALTNARSSTGGVTPVGGLAQRALFQGTGGAVLIIITGSNSALARVGGGAPSMTTTLNRARQTAGGPVALPGTAIVFGGGFQTYYVGGTLTVPANQPPGDYLGTFTLTVNYL